MDEGYWRARFEAARRKIEEHARVPLDHSVGHSTEYQAGYHAGRLVAYERSALIVGSLLKEWRAATAREGGSRPG